VPHVFNNLQVANKRKLLKKGRTECWVTETNRYKAPQSRTSDDRTCSSKNSKKCTIK